MPEERLPYADFVKAESARLLALAKRLREVAERWEEEAEDLKRVARQHERLHGHRHPEKHHAE